MKRCSRCVLPDNAPGISFDGEGVCNYCRSYKRLTYKGEGELVELLDSYRRRDSRYDCMVPISGGRDSSFMVIGYLFGNQYTLGSKLFGANIDKIDLFFYLPWNEQQVVSRIRSEMGWESPARFASTWRFDCRVCHLKDYMFTRTIGVTLRLFAPKWSGC